MNYVQVRFQESSSLYRGPSDKLYTYRNRCDLVAGDYAMVDGVAGQKRVVRVASVHKTNPSAFNESDLKWIQGAVYLDEEVLAAKQARERLAEIWAQIIERKKALEDFSVLTSAEKREYQKLLRTLKDGA